MFKIMLSWIWLKYVCPVTRGPILPVEVFYPASQKKTKKKKKKIFCQILTAFYLDLNSCVGF